MAAAGRLPLSQRAVRFFGEPVVNGAQRLLLDVTLTSTDKTSLEVSTPVLQF